MRRASSSRALRRRLQVLPLPARVCAQGRGDCARAHRPVRSAAVGRPGRAGLRRGAHARAARRAGVGCRAGSRRDDDLRGEIARANARALRPGAWSRFAAPSRASAGAEVFPLLGAFWELDPDATRRWRAKLRRGSRRARRWPVRACCSLVRLWTATHCTRPSNRTAPSSWTKSARGAAAPPDDDVRLDDDPLAGARRQISTPTRSARAHPLTRCAAGRESMLDDIDAVVVSLPPDDAVFGWDYPALRDLLQARRIPHVCLRGDPYRAPTPADHAALDALVSAASRLQEARHG